MTARNDAASPTPAEGVERLREEHAQLRRHVASTPLALVEWDGDFRVVGYSARAQEMFGYAPEEVLGKRIDEIPWVPEEDWPSVRAVMSDMWTAARPTNVNANRNVRKDGSVIDCEWYNSALHDASGRLVSMLSLVLDVTERNRAVEALRESELRARAAEPGTRASEERFRRRVEVSSQIVWVTGADGRAVEDSPSWRAFTGRTYEEWAGDRWLEAIHPDDRARLAAAWRHAVETRSPYAVEFRQIHASGAWRHMECRAVPILDDAGGVREWVGMNVDITERKLAEAALRDVNELLRDADRRKDEFLAMLSHELRNPLAPIRNAVAILDRATPTGAQAARARAVIGRQVQHLARIVDDLLDVTRIARGKIELRRAPLDLVPVVQRAAEDHRPLLYERGVSLAIVLPGAPAWVDGDGTRLTQVLGNLLQNAAKFTEHGGRVTVALAVAGDEVEVRVRDTGVGIAPELLGRIFEPFVQSDQSLARSQGGLGLGLALVKGIVELHGGTVRAESAGPGQGAEIVVRLPAATSRDAPLEAPRQRGAAEPLRVLVVDDNRDAAESLAEILRILGHAADVAIDGAGAIARARASAPDVVLCDLGLPGMDGYAVARALRAEHGDRVRLVAVSGYARPEDVERARAAGFDGHVAKPADPQELVRLLGA